MYGKGGLGLAAGGAGGALAFTGFSVIAYAVIGIALVVLGLVLVRLTIQRRSVG
jgi:hypothetical protein